MKHGGGCSNSFTLNTSVYGFCDFLNLLKCLKITVSPSVFTYRTMSCDSVCLIRPVDARKSVSAAVLRNMPFSNYQKYRLMHLHVYSPHMGVFVESDAFP